MTTTDARENHALGYLRPALAQAMSGRRPVTAEWIPTSLSSVELGSLASRLCAHAGANCAILTNPSRMGVTFTPLC
jgi:hypothetical protein